MKDLKVAGRILIIDDDPLFVLGFEQMLSEHGFKVAVHSSAITVAFIARAFDPDVVLLDVDMPALSGASFLGGGGRKAFKPNTPVVLLSGKDRRRLAALCTEIGADGAISKEEDISTVLRTLAFFVQRRRVMTRLKAAIAAEKLVRRLAS